MSFGKWLFPDDANGFVSIMKVLLGLCVVSTLLGGACHKTKSIEERYEEQRQLRLQRIAEEESTRTATRLRIEAE